MKETELPNTFPELQRFINKNPKKFGYNAPNTGGGGGSFIQRVLTIKAGEFDGYAQQVDENVVNGWSAGWQWFEDNRENMILTGSGADSLTRLNDGEFTLVPSWEDHMLGLQKTGAITSRLKFYVPEFGMAGGGNVVAIAHNSQHPAASMVFINWLIHEETQIALHKEFGAKPLNKKLLSKSANQDPIYFFSKDYGTQVNKEFMRKVMMK